MTQTPRLALTAVALATVMALSACGKQEQSAGNSAAPAATDGTTTVKIGFSAPLTGPQAHYGEEYKNGVTLAIEDVNAEQPKLGGQPVKFELVAEDDQADPKTATQIAQKFVDAKVNGIIGHFNSGTAIPASKIYADAGIPGIAIVQASSVVSYLIGMVIAFGAAFVISYLWKYQTESEA